MGWNLSTWLTKVTTLPKTAPHCGHFSLVASPPAVDDVEGLVAPGDAAPPADPAERLRSTADASRALRGENLGELGCVLFVVVWT